MLTMKIRKIKVNNFRLLENFEIDLENELSLVIGKNNTGKTSLLAILNKFLNESRNAFSFDDFNVNLKNHFEKLVSNPITDSYEAQGITLKLFIGYNKEDYLANISQVMLDLDPENNTVVLAFEYLMNSDKLNLLKEDFDEFKAKESAKKTEKEGKGEDYDTKGLMFYLRRNHSKYFVYRMKSVLYDKSAKNEKDSVFIDIGDLKHVIRKIINFKSISAKRDVTNKENNRTLSIQTSAIYEKTESKEENDEEIEKFRDQLIETDDSLTAIYEPLFEKVVDKVKRFGGVKENDSLIKIESSLKDRNLLSGNTTVTYTHETDSLPEYHNGLGYMNLISMIFEIEIQIQDFKRKKDEKPADINLLFIEEPEAHTHPQMQYIFINNIKDFLKEGIEKGEDSRDLQTIISTHSSHIVSECKFEDIKYLKKDKKNSIISKNLNALKKEYVSDGEDASFKFLKQYLTLHRSELFFADKAILIEGDTERILLPAMMKKIDQEEPENALLSQNISIVEVGAHSRTFEKFIDFIGIQKCLIITDIDSFYKNDDGQVIQVPVSDSLATKTSNNSLKFFFKPQTEEKGLDADELSFYKSISEAEKTLSKNEEKKWVATENGIIQIAFQTEENSYHARSFEDSFLFLNQEFIKSTDNNFPSITPKWLKKYREEGCTEFELAEKGINSKPSFAIEVLLNSKTDEVESATDILFSNWETPLYIKTGLQWLKKG